MKEKIKDSVPDFLSASFYLIIILPKVLTANEQICIVYLFTLPYLAPHHRNVVAPYLAPHHRNVVDP